MTLLEAAAHVGRKVCGEYLCPQGVELLEQLGLYRLARGRPLVGMRIVTPKGRVLTPSFPSRAGRPSFGLALNRQHFERELLELATRAGVGVLPGRRLREVKRVNDRWELRVDGPHGVELHRPQLLVGADGRRSAVARALGPRQDVSCERVALHGHFHYAEGTADRGEMHLLHDGAYIGVDPTGEHEVNVSLVCAAARVRALGGARGALEHHLAAAGDYHARYGAFPHSSAVKAVSPVSHRVKASIAEGAALVGDAAGFVHPLTGEGIFYALWGARALAEALSTVRTSDTAALDGALRRYAQARRAVVEPKWRLHHGFQWLLDRPRLIEHTSRFLAKRPRRADAFLGIIGNIYRPLEGLARTLTA